MSAFRLDRPGAGRKTTQSAEPAEIKEKQRFTCDLPISLHKQLKVRAIEEGRAAVDLVIDALHDYLEKSAAPRP